MSTSYYRLRSPFTSARLKVYGSHTSLSLWVNHTKAGELTLRNEEVVDVLFALKRDDESLMSNSNGLHAYDDMELETTLLSESGELTIYGELKRERDGMV